MSDPTEDPAATDRAAAAGQPRSAGLPPAAWAALGVVIAALFTCISATLTTMVPEIGQTIRQVLQQPAATAVHVTAPAPTAAPQLTTLPAATAAPAPSAQITGPLFASGAVPMQVPVGVTFANIPADRFLWVVVRVPKVQPPSLVYPQLLAGLPQPVTGQGNLDVTAQLGTDQDAGQPFNVVVLLLDKTANDLFLSYSSTCLSDASKCSGLRLPNTGAQILDFVTLIRK